MRLVCPNCEAKYEVPEDAIPETGRDVQCANCGHAWFQMRPRTETAPAAAPVAPAPVSAPVPAPAAVAEPVVEEAPAAVEAAVDSVPEAEPVAEAVPEVEAPVEEPVAELASEPEPAADAGPAPEPVAESAAADAMPVKVPASDMAATAQVPAEDEDAEASLPPAAAAGTAAYAVDESVLAILREEADREAKARQAETARGLETQTELGIEQAMPAAVNIAASETDDRGLAARRGRLPDVEEINSTLRPSEVVPEEDVADAMPMAAEGRSSFRSGFLLVMTLAIIASGIYGSADAIAAAVPSLAGPLQSYVALIDSLRLELDGLMQSATVAINGT